MRGPDTYWKVKGTECKVLQTEVKAFVKCGYTHRHGQRHRYVIPISRVSCRNPGQNPTGQNPTLTKPHRTKPHTDKTPSVIFS